MSLARYTREIMRELEETETCTRQMPEHVQSADEVAEWLKMWRGRMYSAGVQLKEKVSVRRKGDTLVATLVHVTPVREVEDGHWYVEVPHLYAPIEIYVSGDAPTVIILPGVGNITADEARGFAAALTRAANLTADLEEAQCATPSN